MSTLATLETDVKEIWKRDDSDTMTPKKAIKLTYRAMLAVVAHHKLQDRVYKSITSGQYELSLPSGVLRINHPIKLIDPEGSALSANSGPLHFMTKQEYDEIEPESDDASPSLGVPWGYTLWKNSIYIVKIPDKAYTLEINIGGEPTDLSEDSDESILSSVWDEIIKAGALTRLFSDVKLYDDALFWRKIYLNGYEGDDNLLVGGLNLLKQLDHDNFNAVLIVKNQPL